MLGPGEYRRPDHQRQALGDHGEHAANEAVRADPPRPRSARQARTERTPGESVEAGERDQGAPIRGREAQARGEDEGHQQRNEALPERPPRRGAQER